MDDLRSDVAYLTYLLREERDAEVIAYIEHNFPEESHGYEINYMFQHPYFANKVLDDFEMSNDEKLNVLLKNLSIGKSKIITIIGGRGQGKTALAMYLFEQSHDRQFHNKFYYIKKGERPEWLPDWINQAQTMEDVPNKSLAMLDETAIEYGSRNFYKDENKNFTERLVILRHKDISLILITQHSAMIDINIRRLSDILVYKKGANLDVKENDERTLVLNRLMPRSKEESLIVIKGLGKFYLVRTGLAEFWDNSAVSKTFKNFNPEEMRRMARKKQLNQELDHHRNLERIRAEEYAKKGIKNTPNEIP